ncbi:MAG TPA: hypothetical protein VL527_17965 [Dongiaceae bacterium]|nr:hypothetical protein [Dongiaceae bacterium]
MIKIILAGIMTFGLVLWAHQESTIGGRVPMVFVALWFGSATMVALIFSRAGFAPRLGKLPVRDATRQDLWRHKMKVALLCLVPLAGVPLLERHGVDNDPAVWLLDCALYISICSVPYFTLLARTVVGGVVLSLVAFQILWTAGACALFLVLQHAEQAKGNPIAPGAAFEAFFRPEYRYLFYILCAVMLFGYCPVLLWLSRRRFLRQNWPPAATPEPARAAA